MGEKTLIDFIRETLEYFEGPGLVQDSTGKMRHVSEMNQDQQWLAFRRGVQAKMRQAGEAE